MSITLASALLAMGAATAASTVTIRFVDQATQSLTPVRVELLNAQGAPVTATNAVELTNDCAFAPLPEWLAQPQPRSIENPFTGTDQHYVPGVGRYELPPGRYTLRAFKGPQFHVRERVLNIGSGPEHHVVAMTRWSDLRRSGWLASDVHLHLARQTAERNPPLATWMAAEDLDIANLLQMGALTHFAASPQYAFGDAGAHRGAGVLLVSGQEHPRTHLFGHALSLGASTRVDVRDRYIQYDRTFAQVREAEGINGFAHWGIGASTDGLAVTAPFGNVETLEVLSFEFLYVDTWYALLNLGFAVTAIAGTDFPCLPSLPGRERTYINTKGEQSREAMVTALRAGRSFVSNGPVLQLSIQGRDIGSRVAIPPGKRVTYSAHLGFDPDREVLNTLELIFNGEVVRTWTPGNSGSDQFHGAIEVHEPGWFALRATGRKLNETEPAHETFPAWMEAAFAKWMPGGGGDEIDAYLANRIWRASYAHTSPVYLVSETGETGSAGDPTPWLARLDRLEEMLEQQDKMAQDVWAWMPYSDGVSDAHLQRNAPALLRQIEAARARFVAAGREP